MLSFGLLLLCFGAYAVSGQSKPYYDIELVEQYFEEFIKTYNKTFDDEKDKQKRMKIFRNNLMEINELNANPTETAHFGINQFADLSQEELQLKRGLLTSSPRYSGPHMIVKGPVEEQMADEFDWRQKKVVSRVKDQGQCGSCYAFSTTGVVESAYAIKHGQIVEVSEQQVVDCDRAAHGCDGGYPVDALAYLKDNGAMAETSYPYQAEEGQCKYNQQNVAVRLESITPLAVKDEEALAQVLVKSGPISISISVTDRWLFYENGVLMNCPAGEINHAVLLVGYGTDNDQPYWIIKNSWGNIWGEQGYVRIRRGVNACSIQNDYAATVVAA